MALGASLSSAVASSYLHLTSIGGNVGEFSALSHSQLGGSEWHGSANLKAVKYPKPKSGVLA